MRRHLVAIAAAFSAALGTGAHGAALVDLSGVGYITYGNANSYSLPLSAIQYDAVNGGGTGPGNPFYVASGPGQIQDLVVIYTGASGTGVTTNTAGFDNAYLAPSGSSPEFASINNNVNMTDPGDKAGIANNNTQTWDASLLALKSFLAGDAPVFLFNNNDTNADQTLAIWAKLWLTDPSNTVYQNRYLYLSNHGAAYGAGGVPLGDASLYNPGNVTAPTTGFASTDFVAAGGNVGGVNHNLGANQAAYAATVPVLNQWLKSLYANLPDATLDQYTLHLDLRLGCTSVADWGSCDSVKIDNGYEQLFLASAKVPGPNVPVPEPGSVALTGLALAGLAAFSRRRRKA